MRKQLFADPPRIRRRYRLWESATAPLEAAGTNRSAAIRGFLAALAAADPDRVAEILEQFPPQ